MRKSALFAGMFLFCVLFFASTEDAKALSLEELETNQPSIFEETIAFGDSSESEILKQLIAEQTAEVEVEEEEKPQPKQETKKTNTVYTVKTGDTLSKIADRHNTSWERLFYKNKNISNPNIISVGDKITIPKSNEKLKKRGIPQPEPQPVAQPAAPAPQPVAAAAPAPAPAPQPTYPVGSSAGNTYYQGYCTWYAKSRRPDLPNNLGNADTWAARAAAQGFATGSAPRVGAIGQQGMHVVYVEAVHGNSTVTVSEMNFNGWNVVSSRTVPASSFIYIY